MRHLKKLRPEALLAPAPTSWLGAPWYVLKALTLVLFTVVLGVLSILAVLAAQGDSGKGASRPGR